MKALFFTIADLGEGKNLKTPEAKGIINALDNVKVFCRTYVGDDERYTPAFKSQIIPKILTFLGKRNLALSMMDERFSQIIYNETIGCADVAIFHPYCFPKTLQACREKCVRTISIGTSAAGEWYDSFEKAHMGYVNKREDEGLFNADYIITYSNWLKKCYVMSGYDPLKIFLTPVGVDLSRFKPPEVKKEKYPLKIVSVADWTPLKGAEDLLEAIKELNGKVELTMVGNLYEELKDNISSDKRYCDSAIVTTGHTDPLPYYQEADIFVLPSLTEGSPRVMYEAMACGLPVIVSENCGPVIEDYDKTFKIVDDKVGFVVPIKDDREIQNKIQWFIDNRDKIPSMSCAAIERVKEFTWDNYTERMKELIDYISKLEE